MKLSQKRNSINNRILTAKKSLEKLYSKLEEVMLEAEEYRGEFSSDGEYGKQADKTVYNLDNALNAVEEAIEHLKESFLIDW